MAEESQAFYVLFYCSCFSFCCSLVVWTQITPLVSGPSCPWIHSNSVLTCFCYRHWKKNIYIFLSSLLLELGIQPRPCLAEGPSLGTTRSNRSKREQFWLVPSNVTCRRFPRSKLPAFASSYQKPPISYWSGRLVTWIQRILATTLQLARQPGYISVPACWVLAAGWNTLATRSLSSLSKTLI